MGQSQLGSQALRTPPLHERQSRTPKSSCSSSAVAFEDFLSWGCCSQRIEEYENLSWCNGALPESEVLAYSYSECEAFAPKRLRLVPVAAISVPQTRYRFSENYAVAHSIGTGTFSEVFQACTKVQGRQGNNHGRLVAAKLYQFQQPPQNGSRHEQRKRSLELEDSFGRERTILCRLRHPHIAKMIETFREGDETWVVLEHCAGADLHAFMIAKTTKRRDGQKGGLEEGLARHLFRQMLHVVAYLHGLQVVHRDLKCENFLLLGPPGSPDSFFVKLCDFGSASQLTQSKPRAMGKTGTLSYTAPEVYGCRGAGFPADCWSLGVVLYIMLTALSPFRELNQEPRDLVVERIRQAQIIKTRSQWTTVSQCGQELIERLLQVEESSRLTVTQAMDHDWMLTPGEEPQDSRSLLQTSQDWSSLSGCAALLLPLLLRWAQLDALQKLVLATCAQVMSEEAVRPLESTVPWYNLFVAMDVDKDGRLSHTELLDGLIGICGVELMMKAFDADHWLGIIQALDVDRNGFVDWGEWLALALLSDPDLSERAEPLRTAFRILDSPSADQRLCANDLLPLFSAGSGEVAASEIWHLVQELLVNWSPAGRLQQRLEYDDVKRLVSAVQLPHALGKVEGEDVFLAEIASDRLSH